MHKVLSRVSAASRGSHDISSRIYKCLFCTQGVPGASESHARRARDIMHMPSNRAFKYVFLRTLPLKSQAEILDDTTSEKIATEIESAAERVIEKYLDLATDNRAKVHLHAAALAVASHRVLTPRIRDDTRVFNMLRKAFGAGANDDEDARLPGHWIGKAGLFFAMDRMAAVRKMTRNAATDFGSKFDIAFHDAEKKHQMTVSKCFYADICEREGVRRLTRIFCALDRALFSHVSPAAHGIEFQMSRSTLADDNKLSCDFVFTRQD